jgi:branched-subunit amino acid transport protein
MMGFEAFIVSSVLLSPCPVGVHCMLLVFALLCWILIVSRRMLFFLQSCVQNYYMTFSRAMKFTIAPILIDAIMAVTLLSVICQQSRNPVSTELDGLDFSVAPCMY